MFAASYAFVAKANCMHIRDEHLPKTQSKKFKQAYEAARMEQETCNGIVDVSRVCGCAVVMLAH